ncbi:MAG: hypothetical protein ACT4UQ_04040 [Gammaproteobacteria bacterium]
MDRLRPWMAAAAALALTVWACSAPAAEAVQLRSGTPVLLSLEHHVTSGYTPVGAMIHLRVAEDVMAGDRVVIRRGTPVRGRMRQAAGHAMMGASGSMTIGIDSVPAVDGQQLRVVASETRHGRDRSSTASSLAMFGVLPGLVTRGEHSYLPRGSVLRAEILFGRRIATAAAAEPPAAPTHDDAAGMTVARHRFSRSHTEPYRLDLGRDVKLGSVEFSLQWDPAASSDTAGWRAALIAVDGKALAEPVHAAAARRDAFEFEAWSVLQYCLEGTTVLRFRVVSPAGEALEADYPVAVALGRRK